MEIKTVNLTKVMGDTTALDSLNIEMKGPGMIGYLGPNGAGKTTTLKLLTNLIFPTSGAAFIDGINVHKEPVKALQKLTALVESPEPYGYYNAREFLNFVAEIRGFSKSEAHKRINELMEKFNIYNANQKIAKLSKGNKRKVMIAAVLLSDCEIIMLDEPTDGLDPIESKVVRDFLKELKKSKLIIMSSHLMYEVSDTCDKVILLNRGKVVLYENTDEVVGKIAGEKVGPSELEEAYIRLLTREGPQ